MKSKVGIYQIKCIANGKRYIGQSSDIKKRIYTHKRNLNNNRHPNDDLQRAWNKYGKNKFSFSILKLCKKNDLNKYEKFYIKKYNSYNDGFNQMPGGTDYHNAGVKNVTIHKKNNKIYYVYKYKNDKGRTLKIRAFTLKKLYILIKQKKLQWLITDKEKYQFLLKKEATIPQ